MGYLKVNCLWIFLLWIELETDTLANDIPVFLVADDNNNNFCVTNQPSAMAFIAPLDDVAIVTENILSDFFPPLSGSNVQDIDCKFEYGEPCIRDWESDVWKIGTSLEGPVHQPITDWRWEAFKLYKTKTSYIIQGETLEYTQVLTIHKDNFELPISIRIESEGHVFLCSGSDGTPYSSDCYWLMLQAFRGTKSAVRKCSKNYISDIYGQWAKPPCSIIRKEREHNGERIVSEDFWSHFRITKKNNTIRVTRNNEELLQFTDDENPFPVRSVFLHSKLVNGLWKIHLYSYLYTTLHITRQLGPNFIQMPKGQTCLSMFVIMCSTCEMLIRLQDLNTYTYIYSQKFKTEDENWKEIKILVNSKINGNYKLYISTFSTPDSHLFWAIDHFRRCNETEYRILKSPKEKVPCQLVKNENTISINNLRRKEISELEINCPESTFGRTCIPCQIFGQEFCSNFKYCENLNEDKQCFCTPGYHSKDCNQSCPLDKYGHGCSKYCGLCDGGCRNIDRICKNGKCLQAFKGDKCNIPPAPLFKDPPSILRIEPTTCAVRVTNFETISEYESGLYYKIQYKEVVGNSWVDVGTDYDFMISPEVDITGLEPDTEYYVRAVLYSNKKDAYEGDFIKKTIFRTSCYPVRSEDIAIKPDNTSASVTLKVNQETCKINNYVYTIESDDPKEAEEHFKVSGLKPSTTYRFTLSHVHHPELKVSKLFSTKGRVPSVVTSLHASKKFPTSINLAWREPLEKNGIILNYIVKYRLIKGKECSDEGNRRNHFYTKTVDATSIVLESLNPYSVYEIQVCAVTSAGVGEDYSIEEETGPLGYLLETEVPQIKDKDINAFDIMLVLNTLECNKVNGPIYLSFEVRCENEWCSKPIKLETKYDITHPMVKFDRLFPNVIYTLTMKVSRFNMDWSSAKEITDKFSTKPSHPNFINSIEVTSKDKSSISLRWKPPYPPTGTLRQYKIKYSTKGTFRAYTYEVEFEPTLCKLWPNYHCATIRQNIDEGYKYNMQIWAANESPWQLVKIYNKAITVTATEDVPESPYDVIETWTGNNDLQVSWRHPNATNGLLRKFVINISTGGRQPKKIKDFTKYINSEKDYNLTYTYQINQTDLQPCSKYTVTIVAHNKNYTSDATDINIWSPPPIPPYLTGEDLATNSTNHTITINIPSLNYTIKTIKKCLKKLYLFISHSNVNADESFDTAAIVENYFLLYNSRQVLEINQENLPIAYEIGNNSTLPTEYKNLSNPPLEPGTSYRINLFFVNECNGKIRLSKVNKIVFTTGDPPVSIEKPEGDPRTGNNNDSLYYLILLIILIPLLAYIYICMKRKRRQPEDVIALNPISTRNSGTGLEKRLTDTHINISETGTNPSKPINKDDLELYIKESIENGELVRQFKLCLRECADLDNGSDPKGNCLQHSIDSEHSAVKSSRKGPIEKFAYINPIYIDGYKSPMAYIATQGPSSSAINEFWWMIWQEKVQYVITIANIDEDGHCGQETQTSPEKFWPELKERRNFGGVRVQFMLEEECHGFKARIFNVTHFNGQRRVHQLHFTNWPDGMPCYSYSLVQFFQIVSLISYNPSSPIVVHCSDGAGKTGMIILCDICLRMAAEEHSVDFLANLNRLRNQRANMVNSVEQYGLAHLVVLEYLFPMNTTIAFDDKITENIKNLLSAGVKAQAKYLVDIEWRDKAMRTGCRAESIYLEPEPQYYVFQSLRPRDGEKSSINSIRMDGFRSPGKYVVTQRPVENTMRAFWKLVQDTNSTVIISLNETNPDHQASRDFWPKEDSDLNPANHLKIQHVKTTSFDAYQIITVRLVNEMEDDNVLIHIIELKTWKHDNPLPNSTLSYLSFWEESNSLARNSYPVVVTCKDGATASGLYIATSFVIEKMKLEKECDVCLAVRTVRNSFKQFVISEEQFEFLYEASMVYKENFDTYTFICAYS